MPLLSIITVNLNNAAGLRATIESVISQSFTDFEYLIIDGASTDGSREVIRQYGYKLAFSVSEPDKGIYHAMNKGIINAGGIYLLFLNSGDSLVDPGILQRVFSLDRSADIVYGDIQHMDKGRARGIYKSLSEEMLTMAYFFDNTIAHPAAFIKRSLFDSGLYDEKLRIVADNKFFYERVVFQNCSVQYLNMVVSNFDTSGLSSQKENWKLTNEERARVINELLPPRIRKDYDRLLLVLHSPLMKYMPVLNQTTGFHKFVSGIVGGLVWIYSFVKARGNSALKNR